MTNSQDHFIFFMDDYGTRTICKSGDDLPMAANEFSFGLGGIIVPSEAVRELSEKTTAFCARWNVPALHGNKIRTGKGKFGFLKKDEAKKELFFSELESIIIDERIIAHACVVCRPGYRDRYTTKHFGASRWEMSKTAFDISVERAAKYARFHNRKLSIVYERSGATEDKLVERYFQNLILIGTEFDVSTSAQHAPLSQQELSEALLSIWPDGKNNALLQLADMVVHPLCHYPTGLPNRAYDRLKAAGQIIDYRTDDPTISVKYSCYDGRYRTWVSPKKHRGP